ncbi:MAG: DNA recombination protein RmuC [Micrococcus sp.]|nr:DNA recombination protein RmuC [Micrococcus sp.]
MDVLSLVLGILVGAVLGAGIAAWLLLRRAGQRAEEYAVQVRELEKTAALAERDTAAARATVQALESRSREAEQQRQQDGAVLQALAPLGERLRHLQNQVSVLERDRVDQYSTLTEQLRSAAATDQALAVQTSELLSALRSTTARGHWGEVQLRRVVEAAGMLAHTDFAEQASLRSPEGALLRPDLLVHVPGGSSIAVDAKAPASHGVAAQHLAEEHGEDAAERRKQLAQAHAAAVRRHVDALAGKQYWSGLPDSPDLVLCFLPSESLLATAVDADPGLLDHAFAQGVALVAPVSLLTALKSVAHTWRQESIAQNAQEVVAAARQLYERLATLSAHLTKLGSSLGSSVDHYNRLLGTLETRVLPSARRIQTLDPALGAAMDLPVPVEKQARRLSAPELTAPDQ